jgi:hypothetical protein
MKNRNRSTPAKSSKGIDPSEGLSRERLESLSNSLRATVAMIRATHTDDPETVVVELLCLASLDRLQRRISSALATEKGDGVQRTQPKPETTSGSAGDFSTRATKRATPNVMESSENKTVARIVAAYERAEPDEQYSMIGALKTALIIISGLSGSAFTPDDPRLN